MNHMICCICKNFTYGNISWHGNKIQDGSFLRCKYCKYEWRKEDLYYKEGAMYKTYFEVLREPIAIGNFEYCIKIFKLKSFI